MSLDRQEGRVREADADTGVNIDWSHCLTELAEQISDQQFRTWIAPLELNQSGLRLVLSAPNRFIRDFVQDKFADRIEAIVKQVSGENRFELSSLGF